MRTQIPIVNNGDLLVIQSSNYTKTIDFENFNVVKTDANKNATVFGNLTGSDSFFTKVSATTLISSKNYSLNGLSGVWSGPGSYNKLTVNGGLITNAFSAIGSLEFKTLTGTILPALTAYQNSLYKYIVDVSNNTPIASGGLISNPDPFTILQNTDSRKCIVSGFFIKYPRVNVADLKSYHFRFMPQNALSGAPYAFDISRDVRGANFDNLVFTVNTGYRVRYDTPLLWRIFYSESI
jgi:hypothetical protein